MSMVRIAVLAVALVAAGLAAYLAQQSPEQEAAPVIVEKPETVRVLIASRDIAPGKGIAAADLEWQEWPEAALTPQFIQDKGRDSKDAVIGALARSMISQGEPIFPARLIKSGEAGVLAALLRPGMRAATIEVDDDTGVAGFVLPNDRVDVVSINTRSDDGGRGPAVSRTILFNVRVIAVDQNFQGASEDGTFRAKTVTLELAPAQVELLRRAEANGDLSLSLRALQDPDGAGADDTIAAATGPSPKQDSPGRGSVKVIKYGITTSGSGGRP